MDGSVKNAYTAAQSGHARRVMDALSKAKCEHVHFMFGPPCGHCYATAHDAIATAIAEAVAQERERCANAENAAPAAQEGASDGPA